MSFNEHTHTCLLCPFYQVPNLAGLARTCEIFAASRLVVPDLRVLKNPSFTKISTGAEQWLPIEELGDKQLLAWIRRVKGQGYTLVGVEQTNNSVCLTKVRRVRRAGAVDPFHEIRMSQPFIPNPCPPFEQPLDHVAPPSRAQRVYNFADEVRRAMRSRAWTRKLWVAIAGDPIDGLLLSDPAARSAALSECPR